MRALRPQFSNLFKCMLNYNHTDSPATIKVDNWAKAAQERAYPESIAVVNSLMNISAQHSQCDFS